MDEQEQKGLYLMIVRHDPATNQWIVDEDSRHLLEDYGGNYPVRELRIETIRALAPTPAVELGG